jgi:hypothetical protein
MCLSIRPGRWLLVKLYRLTRAFVPHFAFLCLQLSERHAEVQRELLRELADSSRGRQMAQKVST